jgi:hypothetical protein
MPRLEVPLTYRRLRSTGDVVVHSELALAIKTERGNWETVTFLIDSGTEMSTRGLRGVKLCSWFSFGPNAVRPRPMVKLKNRKQSLTPSAQSLIQSALAHEAPQSLDTAKRPLLRQRLRA